MSKINLFTRIILIVFCIFIIAGVVSAQKDDETTSRSINSLDFQAQRPKSGGAKVAITAKTSKYASTKRKQNIAVVSSPKRRYNLVKKVSPPITVTTNARLKTEELGITFWRLRPPSADEADAPTFRVKINDRNEDYTAERVSSTTTFKKGDFVRFTVESSRTGYLYIVNREFYTDGTTGNADLIFPTLRTRGGDNRVTAGSLVDIPAATDSVPYFTVKPRRADYAGEELAVIISPIKIPGIEPELRAQTITREKVQKWLGDWSAKVDIYDAADGEGIAYTSAEAEASNTSSRSLTQEEPLPQTIYRVQTKTDAPFVVIFQMNAKTP